MRKNILYAAVFVAALIMSSFTVVATSENAPGQWKKNNEYANQREFVRSIHMRILEILQERNELLGKNVTPVGLLKIIGLLNIMNGRTTELETEEEEEEPEELAEELEEQEEEEVEEEEED